MPTIIKKIPLLLLLCNVTCTLMAQVNPPVATAPVLHSTQQRIMPVQRTYDSYVTEFKQRFPTAGVAGAAHPAALDANRLPTKRSYTVLSQEMATKYPVLQRTMLNRSGAAQELRVMPQQRSFAYYQQQAAMRLNLSAVRRSAPYR